MYRFPNLAAFLGRRGIHLADWTQRELDDPEPEPAPVGGYFPAGGGLW